MRSRRHLLALATVVVAVGAGALASASNAVAPYVVDVQECDRNGGQATVPAGVPISLQNFAFVTGTYGLASDFLLKQQTVQAVLRNGGLSTVDVTDQWSAPQPLGSNPARGWITRLPDMEIAPLAAGETAGAGSVTEFHGPVQIVFPPVGLVDFGPFHVVPGDQFIEACFMIAS